MPGPFPYQLAAIVRSSQREIYFGNTPAPICEVTISSVSGLEILPALIDSGASRTAIPHRVAVDLNLRKLNDETRVGGALGGNEPRPLYKADLSFIGLNFQNHTVVSLPDDPERERILIGRDILNRYTTTLDGPQRQFSIE